MQGQLNQKVSLMKTNVEMKEKEMARMRSENLVVNLQSQKETMETCNLWVAIGSIISGLVVFTFFIVNLCLFTGGCCCYRHCRQKMT